MALSFVIELVVVRHYAFAVMFITPLTILLAPGPVCGWRYNKRSPPMRRIR